MKAILVIIGNEILSGETPDTNSQFIATSLHNIGISVMKKIVVPDDQKYISNALDEAFKIASFVITSGGLGPTSDDKTKATLAEYFNYKLVFDKKVFSHIKSFLVNKNIIINEANKSQAFIPESTKVLTNNFGTAPGLLFEKEGRILISLPGVPFEMKALIESEVIPYCKKKFDLSPIINRNIRTVGIAEAVIAERIDSIVKELPKNINIAFLPNLGEVNIRLTGTGRDEQMVRKEIDNVLVNIQKKFKEYIYGYDDQSLPEVIGELLKYTKATLATAESCTGGYLSHLITAISGSSEYYKGSVIAYSNEIKTEVLGVKEVTLIEHGAVSCETAEQMALGVMKRFNTTFAIATTGIAGPTGGSKEKPVGTVWIAVSSQKGIISKKFQINLGRLQNIKFFSNMGLNLLRNQIKAM